MTVRASATNTIHPAEPLAHPVLQACQTLHAVIISGLVSHPISKIRSSRIVAEKTNKQAADLCARACSTVSIRGQPSAARRISALAVAEDGGCNQRVRRLTGVLCLAC